ncbi:MAG: glycine--tRNA ligase subunit beta [Pseudomonadota bacterium]|nr:glycine--tRNA ligase subunit beta [Pseudomonadota bacterium]
MAELLLEILSEEIPSRMQKRAAEDLKRLVTEGLNKERMEFNGADTFTTPRRLVLVVDGLPLQQPDLREERKGPKVGAPDRAIEGFLRSLGLNSLEQCEKRDAGKGEVWFAVIERPGKLTAHVLPGIINEVLMKFPWPKSMRWGSETYRWVRPVESILCLLDGTTMDGVAFNNVRAGVTTKGHRFLSTNPFEVCTFADYREKLAAAHVMLDPTERCTTIVDAMQKLAESEGLTVSDDPSLLDEVSGLVEWPVCLIGTIDAAFMGLPEEALTSSMRAHQKYFTLLEADGSLAPRFGFVANMTAGDDGAAIVAGNERVLRARLADAKFFWDQDCRIRLSDRVAALEAITFHTKLGTVAEKVQRIAVLAADLTQNIPNAMRDAAHTAALLCKADLVTGMVSEFPDLQGVMGRYYALHDGEMAVVADGIAEHYSPLGPNDRCPTAPVSVAIALADKIDTLTGFWLIDEKPTGSKDPYALRRAALGVIRLILENGLRMNLLPAFCRTMRLYEDKGVVADETPDVIAANLLGFLADRLKVHLRESGVRHDLVSAVFALGGEDDFVRLMARVEALGRFLSNEDGESLLIAYRRAANIVRIESKKDKSVFDDDVKIELLAEEEERALFENFVIARNDAENAIEAEQFDRAMEAMASLRQTVDAFFGKVTVNTNDADLRVNRLCLLSQFGATLNQIANFSLIEG